ncbi:MAG: two-component sensor histidine kinase, partial [Anaerolineae bacterium]|nr:two-component sensor histidine kinase [Anaerolineae bacterium]
KLDWCDVGEVVAAAVQRVEKCMAQHPLTIDLAPNLPLVKIDFVLMEQVLVNLLNNICNYTPPGSPATITAVQTDGKVKLLVSDSGPGLPPDDLDRVFDKFYRAPGVATGGTGLGLSICRGLVEAHRGTLTAENIPGSGARFIIHIPVDDLPPPVREADI